MGTHGQVYPIREPDMLEVIEHRARNFVEDGRYERWKDESIARARRSYMEPPPAPVQNAERDRDWLFDPSISLPESITDENGQVLMAAGTRVNPLDYVALGEPLLFFDGRDPKQVAWAAMQLSKGSAKPILTAGPWIEVSRKLGRQAFFDMSGAMLARLGIEGVPAIVVQEGSALRIREIKVGP